MKKFLKSLPILGGIFVALGRVRWEYRRWRLDPTRTLRKLVHGRKGLSVVQIGSNDGCTGDPVHSLLRENSSWSALLVEPVPFLFARLRKNYEGTTNVRFDQVAIGEEAGTRPFYYITPEARQSRPELPRWFDQLGSFDKGHIERHFGHTVDEFIVSAEIETLPLPAVLARNHIEKIDILHIDTEGYDWIVLRQLDLEKFKPRVILFEHRHLSAEDKSAALKFLGDYYDLKDLGQDYLGTLKQGEA